MPETAPQTTAPAEASEPGTVTAAALTLFFTLAAYISIALIQPPRAVPAAAPPNEFSSGRAMRQLRAVAQQPHPAGSAEHERVRAHIEAELASHGLRPEVQRATIVLEGRTRERPSQAATVRNVVARLKGTSGGDAIVLSAHYDSVPNAPGATDDGAGVATLLETLRALKTGPPLRNDLIFLFTDAEELGLMGARAFAEEHPWMRDVRLVLNFEGRGRGGSSSMFETSRGNELLVREFARAAPHPVANSLMYSLYELLPSDTDMSVFKRAGAAGLNFAYTDGLTHYHTALDTPDETDERSLQHHGTYALALARHFGNLELDYTCATRDAVYFNAPGPVFVHYSEPFAVLLTAAAVLAFAAALFVGRRRKILTLRGIALGFLLSFVCVLAAFVLSISMRRLLARLYPGFDALPWSTPYNNGLFELSLVALTVAVCSALYVRACRTTDAESLSVGAALWWLVLLVASTALLPAASFLFAWPLLFFVAGLLYAFIRAPRGRESLHESFKTRAAFACGATPAVLIVAPVAYMFWPDLPARALALVALLVCPLVPHLRPATRHAWLMPAAFAALGLGLFVAVFATARFDEHRRRVDNVFYVLDTDAGRARWLSSDAEPGEWTSQFFTSDAERVAAASVLPWDRGTYLTGEAPALEQLPPAVEVLEDATRGEVRSVRLSITSPRGAPTLAVYTDVETDVLHASVGGKRLTGDAATGGGAKNYLRFLYSAAPAEGIELRLDVSAARPLKLTVVDGSYGLPETVGLKPRPPDTMPRPSRMGDTTLVKKSFTLAESAR